MHVNSFYRTYQPTEVTLLKIAPKRKILKAILTYRF